MSRKPAATRAVRIESRARRRSVATAHTDTRIVYMCIRWYMTSSINLFGIGEANAPVAQALLEQTVLFLEVLNHRHLMTIEPTGEHHQHQLKRRKQWGHCRGVYRRISRRAPSSLSNDLVRLFGHYAGEIESVLTGRLSACVCSHFLLAPQFPLPTLRRMQSARYCG